MGSSKSIFFLLLLCLCLCQEDNDYAIFMDYSLEFPLASEDFRNWETQGSAIFSKDKLILNPEVKTRQGLVYNKKPINEREWMIDFEIQVGNNQKSTFGTNGMGIYIMKEVLSKEITSNNLYGYTNEIIGAAVYLNSGLRKKDPKTGQRMEGVQGVYSEGNKPINSWEIPISNTCYFQYRNVQDPEGNPLSSTVRLHYNFDSLSISYYDRFDEEFKPCFKMDAKFPDGAYIAVSAASGVWDFDSHLIKSIKTMNPNKIDRTHHAEQAKKMKGERFMENIKSGDVMHKNRLKYDDMDDLVRKLNRELRMFKFHSTSIDNLISSNKDLTPEQQAHMVDVERIHADIDKIIQDASILSQMFNHTHNMIQKAEAVPPKRQQHPGVKKTEMEGKILELELVVRDLNGRAGVLEGKIDQEHNRKKGMQNDQERNRRKQMSESRVNNDGIPSGYLTPELHQQIEQTKSEIRDKAQEGSWLKSLVVWATLLAIAYFVFTIWKGLSEEVDKFK